MARKLRIQYPGAIYHVMNRGDHQELIFFYEDDRSLFVSTLAEVCQKAGWQIHSFCLMSNTEGQLATWRKGHPFKVNLAAKLRAETTVTVSWIAQRLAIGTRGHLAHLLYRKRENPLARSQSRQPTLNI